MPLFPWYYFSMCAKAVLNVQWSQLDDDSKAKSNFCVTIENVHEIMSQQGFKKFQVSFTVNKNSFLSWSI